MKPINRVDQGLRSLPKSSETLHDKSTISLGGKTMKKLGKIPKTDGDCLGFGWSYPKEKEIGLYRHVFKIFGLNSRCPRIWLSNGVGMEGDFSNSLKSRLGPHQASPKAQKIWVIT